MTQISQPTVNVNIVSAVTEVPNDEQRVLFVGQMTSAGSAAGGSLITNIQDDNSWDPLFGPSSMLADMIRNARVLNKTNIYFAKYEKMFELFSSRWGQYIRIFFFLKQLY